MAWLVWLFLVLRVGEDAGILPELDLAGEAACVFRGAMLDAVKCTDDNDTDDGMTGRVKYS